MKKPLNSLSIRIADIIIRVRSKLDLDSFGDIDFYRNFRVREGLSSHCFLDLEFTHPPALPLNTLIFNPANNWQLYKADGKNILRVESIFIKGRPEELVVFNSDYTRGTVYKRYKFGLFRRVIDQFILMNILSQNQGFLLHAAGLIWQNKGICFVGQSGAGKSTLVKLFAEELKRQDLLNDDRLAIRNYAGQWRVLGTPWHGEVPVASPDGAKLKAIFFIRHSDHNYFKKLASSDISQRLIQNSLLPYWDEAAIIRVLNSFNGISSQIPAFEMGFLPDKNILSLIKGMI